MRSSEKRVRRAAAPKLARLHAAIIDAYKAYLEVRSVMLAEAYREKDAAQRRHKGRIHR